MTGRVEERTLRASRPRERPRTAATGLLTPTQRWLFVLALFTFGLSSIYTSVALLTRITPALFPGKNFTNIPIVGDIAAKVPQISAPGSESSFNRRINLLIIGVDTRPYNSDESLPDNVRFAGLTDTIMVATIDPVSKTMSFLSFPRDMLVDISAPGVQSPWKINESYVDGLLAGKTVDAGAKQLEKDMKIDFGIDIDNYVVMNFTGVQKLVDAVGGVDVTIPDDLGVYDWYYSDEGDVPPHYVTYPPGPYHFDGYNAVAFGRNRNPSDFDRVKRQQVILRGAISKVFSNGLLDPTTWPGLYDAYQKAITTDMSYTRMVQLAPLLHDTNGRANYYSVGDPVDGTPTVWTDMYGDASVDLWDANNVAYWVDKTFTKAEYSNSTVEIQNGFGDDGSAREASLGHYLAYSKGLPTVSYGPDQPVQPQTTITLYDSNKSILADDIAKWLNISSQNYKVKDKGDDPTLPDVVIVIGRDYQVPTN